MGHATGSATTSDGKRRVNRGEQFELGDHHVIVAARINAEGTHKEGGLDDPGPGRPTFSDGTNVLGRGSTVRIPPDPV